MFELTIAWRHISSSFRMMLFSVLAVALAVMVIAVMMGMMEGYREEIISNTVENSPYLIVESKKGEDYIHLYRTLSDRIWDYPGVEAVSPRLKGMAAAKYRDQVRGVSIIGVNPMLEDPLLDVQSDLIWGNFSDLAYKQNSVVVGTKLAEDLKLRPGEGFYLIRKGVSLKVTPAGYIQTGTAADESLIYILLETAQRLMGGGDVVSEIGIRTSELYAAPAIASELNLQSSYRAQSWMDKSRDLLNLLETQKVFIYLFYVLIFVIAGFVVVNTMIMAVSRRTREIGILMAMGADRISIVKIFVAESLILGPPSAFLGCILAYIIAMLIETFPLEVPSEIYAVSRMTLVLSPEIFAYAAAFALLVDLAAGLYPAYKASRMDPVEAIASV
jgi:lipoprotein-releasing system permease protein